MTARQLIGIAERQCKQTVLPRLPIDLDARYEADVPRFSNAAAGTDPDGCRAVEANTNTIRGCLSTAEQRAVERETSELLAGTISLLGQSLQISSPSFVEWNRLDIESYPPLWRLQFHGFVPLWNALLAHEAFNDRLDSLFTGWISDWHDHQRIGEPGYLRRSWTPHAVSLRLLHWGRYHAHRQSYGRSTNEALVRGLYKNALFLSDHVEEDVGGNHLIENGIALVIVGVLFRDRLTGRKWISQGIDVLEGATEQFLSDGGHFERSSMYHVIALTRYLSTIDVLTRISWEIPQSLHQVATEASRFISAMQPPDRELPLLNDAVHGQSLSLTAVLEYGDRLNIDQGEDSSSYGVKHLPASGYYWIGDERSQMLLDGGAVGPPHLPGHSHNDLLQILLWIDGRPIVTDTGMYAYEDDDRRAYARGVRGHNTVQVGESEPIPIGGRWLMGPRTAPSASVASYDDVTVFDGSYAVSRRDATYSHRRQVYGSESWWLVWDAVTVHDEATATSRLHFHPDIWTRQDSDQGAILFGSSGRDSDTPIGEVRPLGADAVSISAQPYYPRFGVKYDRNVLSIKADVSSERTRWFGYLVKDGSSNDLSVRFERDPTGSVRAPRAVTIDGTTTYLSFLTN